MIRAAIVGIGTWGQNLVRSVQGKSEDIGFVAGTTGTLSKAQDFSKQNGIALFDSYEKVLQEKSVEAVVLATPHSMHCEQIVAAANAGKHVFVEKPLGLDRKEAERAVGPLDREAWLRLAAELSKLAEATSQPQPRRRA